MNNNIPTKNVNTYTLQHLSEAVMVHDCYTMHITLN